MTILKEWEKKLNQTKIGIDPGLTGAIAIVSDKEILLYDMPVMRCPWKKPTKTKSGLSYQMMVDGYAFMEILKPYVQNIVHCDMNIEIVHSMSKQGVKSSFTFGQNFGAVLHISQAMGFFPTMIRPQAWKGKHNLLCQDKDASKSIGNLWHSPC